MWYEPGVSLLEIDVDTGDSGPVVRLSGLRFADSATIRNFIETHQKFKNSGGTLELLNPQPTVAHAISLLGVDQVLTVRVNSDPEDQATAP